MNRRINLFVAGLLITLFSGCSFPRLFSPPGPVHYQRNNASLHDPYSDNDAGPEVVGGRPRDFQKPSAEPVRSQRFTDYGPGY